MLPVVETIAVTIGMMVAMALLGALLDTLFPYRCPTCKGRLTAVGSVRGRKMCVVESGTAFECLTCGAKWWHDFNGHFIDDQAGEYWPRLRYGPGHCCLCGLKYSGDTLITCERRGELIGVPDTERETYLAIQRRFMGAFAVSDNVEVADEGRYNKNPRP